MSDRRQPAVLGLISALIGGLCGWAGALSGMNAWGLVLGAAVTEAMILGLTPRRISRGMLGPALGFGFAFVLLTSPLLWLVVGYARYLITQQTLGD